MRRSAFRDPSVLAFMTDPEPELTQVLRGLALNREPGWNFPGNFLELSFEASDPGFSELSLEPGPHCVDADGQVDLAASCVLADVCLAVSMRSQLGFPGRMATVAMALTFTGAPRLGRLTAKGRLEGYVERAAARQGIARAEIHAAGALVCTASGTFVALGNRQGLPALPMRRRGEAPPPPRLSPEDLTAEERDVYERARAARQAGAPSFIEHFWGLVPERTPSGARCDFTSGMQVGNRVGHVQGGILFGLAAATANATLGEGWQLVGLAASYLRPGTAPTLHAQTHLLHQGQLSAVARTEIRDPQGHVLLDTTSQHARTT